MSASSNSISSSSSSAGIRSELVDHLENTQEIIRQIQWNKDNGTKIQFDPQDFDTIVQVAIQHIKFGNDGDMALKKLCDQVINFKSDAKKCLDQMRSHAVATAILDPTPAAHRLRYMINEAIKTATIAEDEMLIWTMLEETPSGNNIMHADGRLSTDKGWEITDKHWSYYEGADLGGLNLLEVDLKDDASGKKYLTQAGGKKYLIPEKIPEHESDPSKATTLSDYIRHLDEFHGENVEVPFSDGISLFHSVAMQVKDPKKRVLKTESDTAAYTLLILKDLKRTHPITVNHQIIYSNDPKIGPDRAFDNNIDSEENSVTVVETLQQALKEGAIFTMSVAQLCTQDCLTRMTKCLVPRFTNSNVFRFLEIHKRQVEITKGWISTRVRHKVIYQTKNIENPEKAPDRFIHVYVDFEVDNKGLREGKSKSFKWREYYSPFYPTAKAAEAVTPGYNKTHRLKTAIRQTAVVATTTFQNLTQKPKAD